MCIRDRAVIVPLLLAAVLAYILSGRYTCSRLDVLRALGYGIVELGISLLELPARVLPFLDYEIATPIAVTWEATVQPLLWLVRVPRMVAAFFVGGGLAVSLSLIHI